MADPKLTNGYAPISNEVLEALSVVRTSPISYQIIFSVIRHTWGWHNNATGERRKFWKSTIVDLAKSIARDHRETRRAVARMLNAGVLRVTSEGIGFQSDYDLWGRDAQSPGTTSPQGPPVPRDAQSLKGDCQPPNRGLGVHPMIKKEKKKERGEPLEAVPARVSIIPEVNVPPQPESSGNGPGKAPTPHPAGPPAPPRKRTHWEALMPHAPLGRHWRWGDPQPDTWNEGMVKWAPLSTTPGLLPSGRRDSVRERGLLGHPEYYPADHKDWNSTSFETRDDAEAAWRNANAAVIRLAKHEDLIPFDRAQNAGTLYDVMNAAVAAAEMAKYPYKDREHAEAPGPLEPIELDAGRLEALANELLADEQPEPEPRRAEDRAVIGDGGKEMRRQAARAKALRQAGGLVSEEGIA